MGKTRGVQALEDAPCYNKELRKAFLFQGEPPANK